MPPRSGSKKQSKKTQSKRASRAVPVQQPSATNTVDLLDTLLAARFHGASNIRGIRFQVRYSVLRCAELAAAQRSNGITSGSLRFEGIEDLDTLDSPSHSGLRVLDELVQLKSSERGWTWAALAEPIANFLEAYRSGANLRFRLVINFAPWGELAELLTFSQRRGRERAHVVARIRALVKHMRCTSTEAEQLLQRLVLQPLLETDLRLRTSSALAEAFNSTDLRALEALEAILAARVLCWAASRSTVGATEILNSIREATEGIQRAERYQAVEYRWVGPLEYVPDAALNDFYSGKRVRIGHIVSGLDVRRPRWLDQIATAFMAAPVCIIRAPSGHGKSTLAFRYAVERWPSSQTIMIRSAATTEEVAAVSDYLRFRAALGAPIHVIIDADYGTRRWAEVTAAAAAAGAQVLVTVRVEDWARYNLSALTVRKIVEPTLLPEEASEIFATFKSRGMIHPTTRSAQEAYERLRPPHLLLEFVHLITQGRMLEDILRDQIRAFTALGEDPAKKRLLRLVSFINSMGTPVAVATLLRTVPLRDDPQDVVGSLVGEYLMVEDGQLLPLHWVRSEHLSKLLHEGGIPAVTETATDALSLVPNEALPIFIANVFRHPGTERELFLAGLAQRLGNALPSILQCLAGLFEAGEYDFFQKNRALFDEAHQIHGTTGIFFLTGSAMPLLADFGTAMFKNLAEMARNQPNSLAPQLRAIVDRFHQVPRGLDWSRRFLQDVAPNIRSLTADAESGSLLDWCALVKVAIPQWEGLRANLLSDANILNRGLESLTSFAQGLFRYNSSDYASWYSSIKQDLLPFLQLETECVSIELRPASVEDAYANQHGGTDTDNHDYRGEDSGCELMLTFIVEHENGVSPCNQAVQRLQVFRRSLPFLRRFCSAGLWFLPNDMEPELDDTQKTIPLRNLPLLSDVSKNRVWRCMVDAEFASKTYYGLQEDWYAIRTCSLRLVRAFGGMVECLLEKRSFTAEQFLGQNGEVIQDFKNRAQGATVPNEEELERLGPVSKELRELAKRGAPSQWLRSLSNFLQQFSAFASSREQRTGKLALINFRKAQESLSPMHDFFRVLFSERADHFGAQQLNPEELEAFARADLLLEGWIEDPLALDSTLTFEQLDMRRKKRDSEFMKRVRDSLESLGPIASTITFPATVPNARYTRLLALGVPVAAPNDTFQTLVRVCEALHEVGELLDECWLFPLQDGAWSTAGAHHVSGRLLRGELKAQKDIEGAALRLVVPIEPPAHVLALLPGLRRVVPPPPGVRQRLVGLAVSVQWYARQRVAIDSISVGDRNFRLVELEKRLRERLQPAEEAIRQVAGAAVTEITASVPGGSDATRHSRDELLVLLKWLDSALSSHPLTSEMVAGWTPNSVGDLVTSAGLAD